MYSSSASCSFFFFSFFFLFFITSILGLDVRIFTYSTVVIQSYIHIQGFGSSNSPFFNSSSYTCSRPFIYFDFTLALFSHDCFPLMPFNVVVISNKCNDSRQQSHILIWLFHSFFIMFSFSVYSTISSLYFL